MTGNVNAGSIIYEVDMDTAKLLAARREVDAALNGLGGNMGRLEASVNRTERAVGSMERTMSSLSGVAKGVIAALSVRQVAEYGNEWVTVNNKLVNSLRANEQLADVTQRVFDISQNTMSSLQATATLYGRLERSTRSAGTSTQDLITLTSTINKGLAVSGATTEEASSTMTQLSQALASGVLRGEEFNSISENGSRLAVALADSLGVTIGQLRAMAAEGKLTTEVVVNGLLKQSDAIAKEFANTAMTMGQAFTVATNNVTKFVGETSSVVTSIKVFNQGVIALSDNLGIVANVIAGAAVIFGGRFAGALALATQSRIADAIAAKAQAVATAESTAAAANAARVTAIKAGLDKEMALSNLAVAQTEYAVARGSAAEALALENLIAVQSVATQRSATYAEAKLAEAAASRVATAAAAAATTTIGGLARNALALIGGPVGFAVIAAAGIFYFYQKMQQAKQESIDFADKLDAVISKMKTMGQVQLAAEIDNANKSIKAQSDELSKNEASLSLLNNQLEKGRAALKNLGKDNILYYDALANVNGLESDSIQLTAKVEAERNKLSQTISKTGILQAQMNGTFAQGIDLLKRDGVEAGVTAGLINQLGNALDFAGRAKEKFNSSSLKVERPKNVQEYLDKLNDQVEVQGELDERKRAQLQAEKEIRNLGGSEADVLLARERAGIEFDNIKAQQALKKETKEGASEAKKAATQAERNAKILDEYSQKAALSADSTSELSREQSILAAKQKLTNPTPAQVAAVERDAAAIWDKAAALKAQNAVPELKENADYTAQKSQLEMLKGATDANGKLLLSQDQYNQASEQMAQDHQDKLAQIRAGQAVTPQQQSAGLVDPVQALANENARKLALIQQFEQNKTLTEQQALALRNSLNTEYEQQRVAAQWEIWRNQSAGNEALAASFDALAGNASNALTGMLTGSMSAEEAMRSLGSTVLNSLVNTFVQMGVEWVKSAVMGQAAQTAAIATTTAASVAGTATSTAASTAAAATTTAAWTPAAIVASIGSFGGAAAIGIGAVLGALAMGVAGKRKNGGPVSAGSMYQVGEGGMPEIYRASNGSQYMIPGDNGKVISNKDMHGGGGITVINNIENYSSGAMVDTQASNDGNGNITIQTIVTDIANGGQIGSAIATYHNAPRRARG